MLFHTMVGSNDIERSRQFYNAVLGVLGMPEPINNIAGSGHMRLFYPNPGGTNFIVTQPINDEPATVANGATVAFSCNSPEQVQQFHDVAVANGGTSIEDAPGPRESAMGTIHLTYVRDPPDLRARSRRQQAVRDPHSRIDLRPSLYWPTERLDVP